LHFYPLIKIATPIYVITTQIIPTILASAVFLGGMPFRLLIRIMIPKTIQEITAKLILELVLSDHPIHKFPI